MNRLQIWIAILTAIACTVTSGPATATDLALTADLGTSGIGTHLTVPIAPATGLEARFGINYLSGYKFNKNTAQISYDFKASLRTIDALLDWHLTRSAFRITGGLVYNDSMVNGIGVPSRVATFSFDNGRFSTAQIGKLFGHIDFNSIAPYLGIGWSLPDSGRGWGFSSDLGVMYQGTPNSTLTFGGCSLPGAGCALVAKALTPLLAAETKRLDDELRPYRFLPVLRIGVSYRF